MLPKQPNQSLIDGLACLQCLTVHAESVGVREVARELALETTRAHRLLKTLAHLGLAEQGEKGKYHVGPGIHVLAAMSLFGSGLIRRAIAPLESLHRHNLIVAMGVLWRDHVAYLYHWSSGMRSSEAIGKANLYPATLSGLGMALLAQQPAAEVQALYRGKEIPGYPLGIAALLMDLQKARTMGYAEVIRGKPDRTISVCIDRGNPQATVAIGLAGATIQGRVSELVESLQTAASQIATNGTAHGL